MESNWKQRLSACEEQLWINDRPRGFREMKLREAYPWLPTADELRSERDRLSGYLEMLGLSAESELRDIEAFRLMMVPVIGGSVPGRWFVKLDSEIPVVGSVKARGGMYELLSHAERLLREAGVAPRKNGPEPGAGRQNPADGPSPGGVGAERFDLLSAQAKSLFEKHRVVVSSTGNLGISIGMIARIIGFNARVHMSRDAQSWKIELLRSRGADVVLHEADYSKVVTIGRREAAEEGAYFVDDENSSDLFRGYALAGLEIAREIEAIDRVGCTDRGDAETTNHPPRPVFVYLPCGVGGAPAGIAYGIKVLLGDRAHIFLVEPTHSPSVLAGLASGRFHETSVYDWGIDGATIADGLAVPRMSGLVGPLMAEIVDGICTVSDDKLRWLVYAAAEKESIRLEPSAASSLCGPVLLYYTSEGFGYLRAHDLLEQTEESVHISWATGGGLMPRERFEELRSQGEALEIEEIWK